MRIIWLNWGLTDDEIDEMPPSICRAFGFEAALEKEAQKSGLPTVDTHGVNQVAAEHYLEPRDRPSKPGELTQNGEPKQLRKGLGSEIGPVELADGSMVQGGRLLMRNTWNARLTPELDAAHKEGLEMADKPDA